MIKRSRPSTARVPPAVARVPILGVGVSAVNLASAVEALEGWIQARQQTYVCVTPVHGIMECQRDPELRAIFNSSGLTTPDGMPLVWMLRARGYPAVSRVYGPDLMLAVCRRSLARGWRHYLFGGRPGVARRLAARLRRLFPGLRIVGAEAPPAEWRPGERSRRSVRRINSARADLVWVGLSTPKQERWMALHRHDLRAPVLLGVGAAFDFLSGAKPQAPGWMQRSGLEWLFRLASEPARLWRRYLVDNPLFVILVLAEAIGWRREPVGGRPRPARKSGPGRRAGSGVLSSRRE